MFVGSFLGRQQMLSTTSYAYVLDGLTRGNMARAGASINNSSCNNNLKSLKLELKEYIYML